MNFTEWEPVYEAILADFGYCRRDDERARDQLATLVSSFDLDRLGSTPGSTVAIAGGGPSLADELSMVRAADVVFAASTAAEVITQSGTTVDCMVTDLDKTPSTAITLTHDGIPVAVHAHGDNRSAIQDWVPQCATESILPTTQATPNGPVRNFGGFTDGDRAAFLADHLGAAELVFPGWDFDDPTVSPEKRQKLCWAERLLYWLEQRRGETFDLLDGRRSTIELPV